MSPSGISCKKCNDTGYIIERILESEIYEKPSYISVAVPCPLCQGGLSSRARMNQSLSGIPEVFRDIYLDSFCWDLYGSDTGKQEKIIHSFVENFCRWKGEGMGLYFYSRTRGTGKTRLSCSILNEIMGLYGIRGKFIVSSDILDKIKQADRENRKNPLVTLIDTDLLVLDDLGSKAGNDWLNDTLFRLIDGRMNRGKITVFTSNTEPGNLKLDDRVVDRINRCSLFFPLPEVSIRTVQASEQKKDFLKQMGIA